MYIYTTVNRNVNEHIYIYSYSYTYIHKDVLGWVKTYNCLIKRWDEHPFARVLGVHQGT